MLLRRRLMLLMVHRQQLRCSLAVLDVAPRAARSAPSRRNLIRKRPQTQPLRRAERLLLRLESVDLRRCEWMMLPRVLTRGDSAVPREARGTTRGGSGASAQPHTSSSFSCGSGGARCCGVLTWSSRRTR